MQLVRWLRQCPVSPPWRPRREYRFLHGLRAQFHHRYGIGKSHCACRHQGRILSQTMAGHMDGRGLLVTAEAVGGDNRGKHQRLGIDSLI